MKFVVFRVVPNRPGSRQPFLRYWFKGYVGDSHRPIWSENYAEAAKMDIERSVDTYQKVELMGITGQAGIIPMP